MTTNPVLAYQQRYEATHPKDYSFEGTLARISGMTKDDIAFLLEVSEYSNFLANYDPSTRYAFYEVEPEHIISIEDQKITPQYYGIVESISPILIDKRNYLV